MHLVRPVLVLDPQGVFPKFSQIFRYSSFGEPAFFFDGFIYGLTLPWLIFVSVPAPTVPVVPCVPYLAVTVPSHFSVWSSRAVSYIDMSRVSTYKMCRGFVRDGTKTQYDDKPAIVNNRTEWTVRNKVM